MTVQRGAVSALWVGQSVKLAADMEVFKVDEMLVVKTEIVFSGFKL